MYIVYEHISPCGKIYVGMTKQSTSQRWRNGLGYRRCTHFWNAIQKYGWESFNHIIAADGINYSDACREEQRLIAKFKSNDNRFGYNIESGGDAAKSLSEETKKKMSEAAKKRFSIKENREKQRELMLGRTITESTRKKISMAKKGMYIGENNPRAKSVMCLETKRVFKTQKEAAKWANVAKGGQVGLACKGLQETCGGYHWHYVFETGCVEALA